MRRILPTWSRPLRGSRISHTFTGHRAPMSYSVLESRSQNSVAHSIGKGEDWTSLPKVICKQAYFWHKSMTAGRMHHA